MMETRAQIQPNLPHPRPTTACWQDPPASISDLQSTPELSAEAKYVIVGSGISGACFAHSLLQRISQSQDDDASVLMLEARGACSGATGRNGGHSKCASYTTFPYREQRYGLDEASKIAALERTNVEQMQQFAQEHGIDCDLCVCNTVDIFFNQHDWAAERTVAQHMNDNVPSAEKYTVSEGGEARARYKTPNAIGAIEYPAGSMSAYKFVIGVLQLALKRGLQLHTHTPVLSIAATADASAKHRWRVQTTRGNVMADNVILTTNGYTARLWNDFRGCIVPLRGQITAQRPGLNMPASGLPVTYSFRNRDGYEYMISRQSGSKHAGDIVIGGGLSNIPDGGVSEFGETDDSSVHPKASEWLYACAKEYFGSENWGQDHPDGRIRQEWTGIMGYSADGIPFVGPVPQHKGLWVSAGFNGRGMTLCFKCSDALAAMVTGGEDDEVKSWFPDSFRITRDRLKIPFEGFTKGG